MDTGSRLYKIRKGLVSAVAGSYINYYRKVIQYEASPKKTKKTKLGLGLCIMYCMKLIVFILVTKKEN